MIRHFLTKTVATFTKQLRSIIFNYWKGAIDIEAFEGEFNEIVQSQLRLAYASIAKQYGITPKFYSPDEQGFLDEQIAKQQSFIANFAAQLAEAKNAEDGKVQSFYNRVELWANRWNDMENQAHIVFGKDMLFEWTLSNQVKQHCEICLGLAGTVKRNSEWQKSNYQPGDVHLKCGCSYKPVASKSILFRHHF